MAYSSVRVQFELGHEASVRTKKTPEGFTHDWEVFVRGADNTVIQYFVDKVVFHLHETFTKPRRVIKEPPYVVKESGYAGFLLLIDVYLKNKEEPKKISFQYDLTLQPSGPPISRVLREPRLFQNPSEDFRRKLIRGGGVGVGTPSEIQGEPDLKFTSSTAVNKSRLTDSPAKRHKTDPLPNDSFAQLFGTPIRRVQDPKKLPEFSKKNLEADLAKEKKKVSKHSSYKDEKDIQKEKEKYSEKDRSKDRDKIKEKPNKRPASPSPVPPVIKSKDEHKKYEEKEKKKEEYDNKKKKKEEKDKKEKSKDFKESDKLADKEHKKEKKESKDGDFLKKLNSSKPSEVKTNSEKHNSENVEKEKERPEKEKHKHRHKKKDKEKNREKDKSEKDSRERDRDKDKTTKKKHEEMREKDKKTRRKSRSPSPVQERVKKGPLNALLDELGSSDSASPLSEEEDPIPIFKSLSKPPVKIVPEIKIQPVVNPKLKSTNSNSVLDSSRLEKEQDKSTKFEENSLIKNKKEKTSNKKNKKSDKEEGKRKTKEEHRTRSGSSEREDNEIEKEILGKDERERSEKDRLEDEKPKPKKDKENRKGKREKSEESQVKSKRVATLDNNVMASQSLGGVELSDPSEEIRRSDKFTKEYVAQLKDLQHRIMTLEDNAELQKVVRVIAETGQYEITKKTFDFDLCALDFETVKRLQEFFAPT